MSAADLVQRAAACGYALAVRDGMLCPEPTRSERIMPPDLLAQLKANKAAVVAFLTECRLCGRDVRDPEDRERLAQINPFCSVGYARAATVGSAAHAASPGCPYRRR